MNGAAIDSGGAPPQRKPRWPWAVALAAGLGLFAAGTGYDYRPLKSPGEEHPPSAAELRKLARRAPRRTYIVIDRANNRLYLRRGDKILLEAVCSSGSGALLRDPKDKQQWVFDTPSGLFHVLLKKENPVWRKPDWAFIEEGRPPPGNPGERIDYDALGEYALSFGHGYLIHGTLYERLLGRSVTHGCIRLGAEDLRKVYMASDIGTPIYIF